VIAIVYLVFGAIIVDANPIFRPGTARLSLVEKQSLSNEKLRYHVPRAKKIWTAIQIFSFLGLFASFLVIVWCNNRSTAAKYSDSGMEVLCLYFSLFWAIILVVIFHRLGTQVFSGGTSNFLTGMFTGGLFMLGCFFFGCFFFFAPFVVRFYCLLFHCSAFQRNLSGRLNARILFSFIHPFIHLFCDSIKSVGWSRSSTGLFGRGHVHIFLRIPGSRHTLRSFWRLCLVLARRHC